MSLADEKNAIREAAHEVRKSISSAASVQASDALAHRVLRLATGIDGGSAVSGFLSIGDEINTLPSLRKLSGSGFRLCLPVVVKADEPLVFREWKEGDPLENGPLRTRNPLPAAQTMIPKIILVPLLAFDLKGNRIGWGGGFYDRTLAAHKKKGHAVVSVGVAYDDQQIDAVPVDHLDMKMDWVVTEKRTLKVMKENL